MQPSLISKIDGLKRDIRGSQLSPVTATTRSPALPDVLTMGEFVPGFEVTSYIGIVAPSATPTEIIDQLNREINAGLDSAAIKARYAEIGATILGGSPAAFGRKVADEIEKWGKVIRVAVSTPIRSEAPLPCRPLANS